ncbi:MAG: hypothetical protein QOD84_149 [Acidobacteriaceae bacterium]|jgi:hypothetical protein
MFYDAASKKRLDPVVLADEMALIGHALSPANKFEDLDETNKQCRAPSSDPTKTGFRRPICQTLSGIPGGSLALIWT